MKSTRNQEQRTESTKGKLLNAARELFSTRSYAEVSAEEIVQRAGLTRGALYYQFGGKEGLFAELYELVQQEVNARVDNFAANAPDEWTSFRLGCQAFLRECLDPVVQRIILLDAPVVLSWKGWLKEDEGYGFGSLKQGLIASLGPNATETSSIDAKAHMLLGAMNELSLWIARSETPVIAVEQASRSLDYILDGLASQWC